MSSPYRPSGIYSAQWLPVNAAGRVDRAALAAHLAFEKRAGVAGLLGLGSTGEFPHFSTEERKESLALLAELAAPLPVIAWSANARAREFRAIGRSWRFGRSGKRILRRLYMSPKFKSIQWFAGFGPLASGLRSTHTTAQTTGVLRDVRAGLRRENRR